MVNLNLCIAQIYMINFSTEYYMLEINTKYVYCSSIFGIGGTSVLINTELIKGIMCAQNGIYTYKTNNRSFPNATIFNSVLAGIDGLQVKKWLIYLWIKQGFKT